MQEFLVLIKQKIVLFRKLRRCAHIYNSMRYKNLFANTIAVTKLHLSKKEQSIAYLYISKTFPTAHFFIILNRPPRGNVLLFFKIYNLSKLVK